MPFVCPDPTENLAEEITSDLISHGSHAGVSAPAAAGTGVSVLQGRYLLDQVLGSGGMAVICRAQDLHSVAISCDGAYVAIKLLRRELRDCPHSIARLRREFLQTRSLEHPNVVQLFDLGCDAGTWFIAMELLRGAALGRLLRRASARGLPISAAMHIATACGCLTSVSRRIMRQGRSLQMA